MDGTVLQQESYLNNIRLRFTRSTEANAQAYLAKSNLLRSSRTVDPLDVIPDPQTAQEFNGQQLFEAISGDGKPWYHVIPRLLPQEAVPGTHDPFEQYDRPEPKPNLLDAEELFQGLQ